MKWKTLTNICVVAAISIVATTYGAFAEEGKQKAKVNSEVVSTSKAELNTKGIPVTVDNFVRAETDKYFTEHSEKYPVNTFRHSREYSTVKTQVIIRENQDCLYSHAVVDVSEGVTLKNPAWDNYAVIQVIDENEYTIDVIYPGEEKHLTKDMLTTGSYVWLNTRTEVSPENEAGYAAAHKHQDSFVIDAKSAKPYQSKGFNRASLDSVRQSLVVQSAKILSWKAFGMPDDVDPEIFRIAAAGGWGGLPKEDAIYWPKILPQGDAKKSSVASKITLPKPPLQYDKGGFMSVTVYDDHAWIATKKYALRDKNAKKNADGSITFYFNSPEHENNIETVDNWSMVIRFYMPETPEAVIKYIDELNKNNVQIEVVNSTTKQSDTNSSLRKVTPETFIRAETDNMFAAMIKNAGGTNQFYHFREPTRLDKQTVVRMNRDVLYSGGIFDAKEGIEITFPEMPDSRYASVYVLDNDHYAQEVIYKPGMYKIKGDTRFLYLIVRIQILDPNDQKEIKMVNALQDKFIVKSVTHEDFPPFTWDKKSLDALRTTYKKDSAKYTSWKGMQGKRGEVNEKTRHIAAASAWGLLPEKDAVYLNYTPKNVKENACYSATYTIPENKGFWSITEYGDDGLIQTEDCLINNSNAKLNKDGTFTVSYGSKEVCGDVPNRLDAPKGWNILFRVYRPGDSVMAGEFKIPDVVEVK